jgi:signal transduction histidine kinase/CheY-like chemotaxis protein
MASQVASLDLGNDLLIEIQEQRRDSLRNFAILQIIMGLLWLVFISWQDEIGINSIPAYMAWMGAYGAYRLAERRYVAGCWVLLSTLALAISMAVMLYPVPLVALFGVTMVIAANALFTLRGSLVVAALSWLSITGAWHVVTGDGLRSWMGIGGLALYGLIWCACYLVGLPLIRSVDSAITGWAQARQALREVQERRGELYRTVRALEEATYRIERMNNELLIARWEAENARAFKARFVATVSHEMRGPLNLLLGFSRMIALYPEKYGEPLPDAYLADVDAIYRNCEHLVALVDDVLDLSQIEAESLPLVKDRVDIREDVIDRVVQSVGPLAERKGLYLRTQVDAKLPWVLADAVRVRQALLNLLTNAVRFTQRGGITIRAWVEGPFIHVSVHDTGPGIPAEDLPRLFKEFSQILSSETREAAGSGLGLAISRQLVELHGGDMWVESAEGAGTTLYFSLPRPDMDAATARISMPDRLQVHDMPHSSCLVVHDDADMVRLLARYMGDYRVIGLSNENEITGLLEEMHPKAIITTDDWRERVLAELSRTPYDVPVLSFHVPYSASRHHLKGVLGYLVKPVSPEILWSLMRRIDRDGEIQVLLVDDDPDAVRLMEDMLTLLPHPYRILRAYDGLQALEVMQTVTPDIVFLDLMMTELGGEETIRRMRELEHLADVPVVIVSARDATEGSVAIGSPLRMDFRDALSFTQGNKCLVTLLDCISPRYLPDPKRA